MPTLPGISESDNQRLNLFGSSDPIRSFAEKKTSEITPINIEVKDIRRCGLWVSTQARCRSHQDSTIAVKYLKDKKSQNSMDTSNFAERNTLLLGTKMEIENIIDIMMSLY